MPALALPGDGGAAPGEALWEALAPLCGYAFAGRVVAGTEPSDAAIAAERLVMWVRDCGEDEIRIPFHVGDDRSRTWVLTRTAAGVHLHHVHRHEDGSEDTVSRYGGHAAGAASGTTLDFPADHRTAAMLPAAATNVWTVAVEPGHRFVYALRREAEDRRFRVELDLTRPLPPPEGP